MSLFFQTHFQDGAASSGGSCPTITLGDLAIQPLVGMDVEEVGAFITEGEGPFTLNYTGDYPDGATAIESIEVEPGVWAWHFTGATFSTLGIFTGTVSGTDANGCEVTPKEYTMEVKLLAEGVGLPTNIPGGIEVDIPVSGLTGYYGMDYYLERSHLTVVADDLEVAYFQLRSPINVPLEIFNGAEGLPGTNIDANFINPYFGVYPNINTASNPYDGDYNEVQQGVGYDEALTGRDTNGTFKLYCENNGPGNTDVNAVSLLFSPINYEPVSFNVTGGVFAASNYTEFPFVVSGVQSPNQFWNQLRSVLLSITHVDTSQLTILLVDPSESAGLLINSGDTTGANLVDTNLSLVYYDHINTGSAPYTGDFQISPSNLTLAGIPMNGTWKIGVLNADATNTGTLDSATVTFNF